MNKLVEITGHSEALDAQWYCHLFGKDLSSLSVRDCLGVAGDVLDLGQLIVGKYRIVIIYDKEKYGLHQLFPSDDMIEKYVQSNLIDAFNNAVAIYKEGIYLLNIASVENFGAFEWKNAKDILDKQLKIFMPIIQKFMADALTNSLKL